MPGIQYAWGNVSRPGPPRMQAFLLGSNLTGTQGQTATTSTALYQGDPVVLTTSGTYSSGSVPVLRMLNYRDAITNTYQVSSNIVGFLGFAVDSLTTNANGQINGQGNFGVANTPPTPVVYAMPAMAGATQIEFSTARNRMQVMLAGGGNIFQGRYQPTSTTTANQLLVGKLAGFSWAIINGCTFWFIDDNAATKPLIITGISVSDPQFNASITGITNDATTAPTVTGPLVQFEVLSTYSQLDQSTASRYYTN